MSNTMTNPEQTLRERLADGLTCREWLLSALEGVKP